MLRLLAVLFPLTASPHLRSEHCLHGMCAAHWTALQTAVQLAGGIPSCGDIGVLPHVLADLHAVCAACGALLTDASPPALFSDVIVQLAPKLAEVKLMNVAVGPGEGSLAPQFYFGCVHCVF